MSKCIPRWLHLLLPAMLALLLAALPEVASAQTSNQRVERAQVRMNELLPRIGLAEDGIIGPRTMQALCGLRRLVGHTDADRGGLTQADMRVLRNRNTLPAPAHGERYISVDKTCQLVYLAVDGEWVGVMPASTGKPGYVTPSLVRTVEWRWPGWHNSSSYPSAEPNMYESLYFLGGYALHGSYSVPPYPASHGCVRVSIDDADFISDRAPNGTKVSIYGSY